VSRIFCRTVSECLAWILLLYTYESLELFLRRFDHTWHGFAVVQGSHKCGISVLQCPCLHTGHAHSNSKHTLSHGNLGFCLIYSYLGVCDFLSSYTYSFESKKEDFSQRHLKLDDHY